MPSQAGGVTEVNEQWSLAPLEGEVLKEVWLVHQKKYLQHV